MILKVVFYCIFYVPIRIILRSISMMLALYSITVASVARKTLENFELFSNYILVESGRLSIFGVGLLA